jgi:hypothetical protein
VVGFGLTIFVVNRLMTARFKDLKEARFRIQVLQSLLLLAAVISAAMALPMKDSLRSQLLGLIGILLSAAIALASTTFLGNALAGVLLRVVGSFRLGDFV